MNTLLFFFIFFYKKLSVSYQYSPLSFLLFLHKNSTSYYLLKAHASFFICTVILAHTSEKINNTSYEYLKYITNSYIQIYKTFISV